MQISNWIIENWVAILNAAGVVGSLLFTAMALRATAETQRIANLLAMTTNHRDIWKQFFEHPELARVLDASADLAMVPLTPGEREFINMVILHVSSVYESVKDKLVARQEGLCEDVRSFFSLPLPKAVWEKTKIYQNEDFVQFIESCQKRKPQSRADDTRVHRQDFAMRQAA